MAEAMRSHSRDNCSLVARWASKGMARGREGRGAGFFVGISQRVMNHLRGLTVCCVSYALSAV